MQPSGAPSASLHVGSRAAPRRAAPVASRATPELANRLSLDPNDSNVVPTRSGGGTSPENPSAVPSSSGRHGGIQPNRSSNPTSGSTDRQSLHAQTSGVQGSSKAGKRKTTGSKLDADGDYQMNSDPGSAEKTNFAAKLRRLLDKGGIPNVFGWSNDGTKIWISDDVAFMTVAKERGICQSNLWESFSRQLIYYGFTTLNKPRAKLREYKHPEFQRDQSGLAARERRKNNATNQAPVPDPLVPELLATIQRMEQRLDDVCRKLDSTTEKCEEQARTIEELKSHCPHLSKLKQDQDVIASRAGGFNSHLGTTHATNNKSPSSIPRPSPTQQSDHTSSIHVNNPPMGISHANHSSPHYPYPGASPGQALFQQAPSPSGYSATTLQGLQTSANITGSSESTASQGGSTLMLMDNRFQLALDQGLDPQRLPAMPNLLQQRTYPNSWELSFRNSNAVGGQARPTQRYGPQTPATAVYLPPNTYQTPTTGFYHPPQGYWGQQPISNPDLIDYPYGGPPRNDGTARVPRSVPGGQTPGWLSAVAGTLGITPSNSSG